MNLGPSLCNLKTFCISIGNRSTRRERMNKQIKRKNLGSIKYHLFKKDDMNPNRGCINSHLQVIDKALEQNLDKVLILEDDAKFVGQINIKKLPKNWDILYLGGSVTKKHGDKQEGPWVRVNTMLCHAYILNLNNKDLINEIKKIKDNTEYFQYDNYFNSVICEKFKCYIHNPMFASQFEDVSDIENRKINYDHIFSTLEGYQKPNHNIVDNQYILKLDDIENDKLPFVSLITPIGDNRSWLFPNSYQNFLDIDYPSEKLEWIIVGTLNTFELIEQQIKNVSNIKFIECEKEDDNKIYKKRNLAIENSDINSEFILHFDDDDYYPAENVKARVKIMLKYNYINCVGSAEVGCYDIISKNSGMIIYPTLFLCEASLGYRKTFWNNNNFSDNENYLSTFLGGKYDEIMDVPFVFILTSLAHSYNYKKEYSKVENKNNETTMRSTNLYDDMSKSAQLMIEQLSSYLKYKNNNNNNEFAN